MTALVLIALPYGGDRGKEERKCQADFQERCVSSREPAAAWAARRP